MKNIFLTLIILSICACKQGNKEGNSDKEYENEVNTSQKTLKDNKVKIILNLKITENNRIDVFYIGDNPNGGFNDKELVSKNVLGDKGFQVVELELPKDILPYSLRIDIGENSLKTETPIEITDIKIILNDNVIEIDSNTLEVFFQPNIYFEKISNGLYRRKIVDGKFDPYFVSKGILNKKIEIEL